MSRILIIDDDPVIRQAFQAYFGMKGHQVITAKNGAEGLAMFNASKFDIVVTDLMMPKSHGFQVIDKIKASEFADTPVLLMTADQNEPKLASYQRTGCQDALMTKPFDLSAVEEKINAMLSGAKKWK